jgi:hypothetical protein
MNSLSNGTMVMQVLFHFALYATGVLVPDAGVKQSFLKHTNGKNNLSFPANIQ